MNKRILYIDDELLFVRSLAEALEEAGYEVKKSNCHATVFQVIEKEKPDLIVLDLLMPTKTQTDLKTNIRAGLSTLKDLRLQKHVRLPIIFVTVVDDIAAHKEIRRIEKDSGFNHVVILVKPVLPSTLLENVRGLIGNADVAK
jgi:CheY-like chemotaxis protein